MAEWSKALASGASLFVGVGSNPTVVIILLLSFPFSLAKCMSRTGMYFCLSIAGRFSPCSYARECSLQMLCVIVFRFIVVVGSIDSLIRCRTAQVGFNYSLDSTFDPFPALFDHGNDRL